MDTHMEVQYKQTKEPVLDTCRHLLKKNKHSFTPSHVLTPVVEYNTVHLLEYLHFHLISETNIVLLHVQLHFYIYVTD